MRVNRRGNEKTKAYKVHAKRRAQERLGFNFCNRHNREVARQIAEGAATLVRKTSNSRSVYDVVFDEVERPVRVVWDRHRAHVVTILTNGEESDDVR